MRIKDPAMAAADAPAYHARQTYFRRAGLAALAVFCVSAAGLVASLVIVSAPQEFVACMIALAAASAGAGLIIYGLNVQTRRSRTETEALVRELDQALAATREARDSALKEMQVRTETFAKASHELRTPLNAILGYAELIQHRHAGPRIEDKYLDYAGNIFLAGTHMLDVVTDVLNFGQLDAGAYEAEFTEVEIGDACAEVLRLVNHQAGEKAVALWSEAPPDLPKVMADRRAIRQMLLNLVGNAIKFSPEGGAVTMRAWCENDAHIRIAVVDTGPGIPDSEIADIQRAFQRASNTRHSTVGHGLGLSITASLVELHGGSLTAANTVEGGAEFIITLPLRQQRESRTTKEALSIAA